MSLFVLREIQQNPNIIYFWMSKEERDNNQELLKNEYNRWKNIGYQVCTFVSGKKDLIELTKELLVKNRNVFAIQANSEYIPNLADV